MRLSRPLTMRATVERTTGGGGYGAPPPTLETVGGPLPCYVQPSRQKTVTSDGRFLSVTMFSIWTARDADLANEDTVSGITDRAGNVLFEGKHRVTSLISREGHLDGILESYG